MRVPDLDWPPDLFTDVIGMMPEATVVLYAAAPTKPSLWTDLLNAWMGYEAQTRPVRMFDCEQAAL
jgi:hypothetical protein